MRWSSASETHPGNLRQANEDAIFASPQNGLWLVADGMGGHNAGDYASSAIAQSLAEVTLTDSLADCVDAVEDRLLEVNDHLREHARAHCDGQTIGSTVVVVISRGSTGVVLWAGDSRLYRLRGRAVELITRDHNPVADLYDSGGVTEMEVLTADTNIVTRAVGGQRELHLDVAVFDVLEGDTLLLCSDGLYREVDAENIRDALGQDVNAGVESLMTRVLGGAARDNVSIVIAKASR